MRDPTRPFAPVTTTGDTATLDSLMGTTLLPPWQFTKAPHQGNMGLTSGRESQPVHAARFAAAAQVAYGRDADAYDRRTASYQRYRRDAVDALPLRGGDVVLDVGCGTGLCFEYLQEKVGPTGHVVGIDGAAPMVELAAERVSRRQWDNVTLVAAPVQQASIPETADAALFCATHDILQSAPALENVVRHLRPGAWVAASGGKWAPTWKTALNLVSRAVHEPFVSSFDGFERPWSLLSDLVEDLRVTEVAFGGGYLAVGRVAPSGG
jgi:ubiquinone/menaquinone biosynthesis C-methylase UbiE